MWWWRARVSKNVVFLIAVFTSVSVFRFCFLVCVTIFPLSRMYVRMQVLRMYILDMCTYICPVFLQVQPIRPASWMLHHEWNRKVKSKANGPDSCGFCKVGRTSRRFFNFFHSKFIPDSTRAILENKGLLSLSRSVSIRYVTSLTFTHLSYVYVRVP